MKVGLITGEYPPLQGGVGAYTRELARALVSAGHRAEVFTRTASRGQDEDGISVAAQVGGGWGWSTIRAINHWIGAVRPDVVNIQFQTAAFNMHPAIHWAPQAVRSVPVVVTFHDLRVPYLFPKAHTVGLRMWIVRRLARSADGVIATDRADEAVLRSRWGIPGVSWIPIGSNIRAELPRGFERAAWRSRLGLQADSLLVSYFGFLNESKGALILVEAAARLAAQGVPIHVLMIGGRAGASDPSDFAYGQKVDALIEERGLARHVHWTGFIEEADVSAWLTASDITALPYLDGVSLRRGSLMAALAHGCAVITTHPTHPIPELDGAVELVAAGDAAALAQAIRDLWQDSHRRVALAATARQAHDAFTWDAIAARTVELYAHVAHTFALTRRGA